MTRLAPNSNVGSAPRHAATHCSPKGRTRVVAWVVAGLLVLHVVAVVLVLALAKWAAADTEAKLAQLQWAFPKTEEVVPPAKKPDTPVVHAAPASDWLIQARRKDAAAPWSYDRSGNVVWK